MRSRPEPLRVALPAVLAGTAVLYLWDLDVSGWANDYYSAAAQAGATSWKAFFFGGLDGGGFSTVDKPPLFLWPMALMVRAFGLSSTAILLPQALEGVAAVWLLHDCVRRATGSRVPALMAALCLAITPVATLMFRFNNPDALLTLLAVGSAWCTLRALASERRALAWLVAGGALVGLAFLTKMLEGVLVTPGLVAAYAVHARTSWPARLRHLGAAVGAALLTAGWWVVVVQLWPTGSRPYVGGSSTDSVLQLALGYNGLARLTGTGSTTLGSGGLGATNLARIGRTDIAIEVLWFLPAALVLGAAGWWVSRRTARLLSASFTLWTGWLLGAGGTFVVMAGTFHAYYAVLLAPALAALVGTGGWLLWHRRADAVPRRVAASAVALTAVVSAVIVGVDGGAFRLLGVPILLLGVVPTVPYVARRARLATAAACLAVLTGPLAFSVSTAATAHTGSGPEAGPANGLPATFFAWTLPGPVQLGSDVADPALSALLAAAPSTSTWAAAAPGSRSAAAYQLASGRPVLAIGGYKGTDPAPTLAQFQALVAEGRVHYLLTDGLGGATYTAIRAWVDQHFTLRRVGAAGYYDLAQPGVASCGCYPTDTRSARSPSTTPVP